MSHYHLEIVMPPTEDVEEAVAHIMKPFDENGDSEETNHPFWDFYSIGGRWAGNKSMDHLDKEKLSEFNEWMQNEKVMVRGFVCGKQELADEETTQKVDAKWAEMFPGAGVHCPMFKHSNDQYSEYLEGDICKVSDISENTKCCHVIVAVEKDDGQTEAEFMLNDEIWNGVIWQKTTWDGTLKGALEMYAEKLTRYRDEYREKHTVHPDWLVVTVDYHR